MRSSSNHRRSSGGTFRSDENRPSLACAWKRFARSWADESPRTRNSGSSLDAAFALPLQLLEQLLSLPVVLLLREHTELRSCSAMPELRESEGGQFSCHSFGGPQVSLHLSNPSAHRL